MEPQWLIGGPNQAEQVSKPQKAEGTYEGKTAAQWREQASRARRDSLDSFDRCDTDGALSQFASDSYARKCNLCAQLAEKDGKWDFPALFTLTGALVPDAVYVKTRDQRWVWRIGRGDLAQWFNESKARSGARRRKNDAAKGFAIGTIRTRARVCTSGTGRGTGGLLSIGYYVDRIDNAPVEIIDNGSLGTQYQDH